MNGDMYNHNAGNQGSYPPYGGQYPPQPSPYPPGPPGMPHQQPGGAYPPAQYAPYPPPPPPPPPPPHGAPGYMQQAPVYPPHPPPPHQMPGAPPYGHQHPPYQQPMAPYSQATIDNMRLEARRAFQQADRNDNGSLDVTEFSSVVRALVGPRVSYHQILQFFAAVDRTQDGRISLDEFEQLYIDHIARWHGQ